MRNSIPRRLFGADGAVRGKEEDRDDRGDEERRGGVVDVEKLPAEGNRLAVHDLRRKDEVEAPIPRHQDRKEMRVLVVTGY